MANKLKLSGPAVLLIIVVPLFVYAGALLIGIQLGRALERSPDSASVSFSIRGALAYLAKELWDANNVLGLGRQRGRGERLAQVWQPVSVSLVRDWIPSPCVEGQDNSSATPKAQQRYRTNNHTSPRGVISVGTWGGSGGKPFYMRASSPPRLRSITLYHSSAIHFMACDYYSPAAAAAAQWGLPHSFGSKGVPAVIELSAGEHVTAVAGTIGHFGSVPDAVITSLTFRTSTGRTYGPYGNKTTTTFSVPAADGACIVGFWGRSGWLLDAIGVYIKPSCSSSNPAGYNYSHQPYAVRPPTEMEQRKI
ncbi:hypothetical protein SETIT_7G305900v2 [Setaria italica]|uniref:Jacalin-type lectin domain-containing protein n=1 Tax=Setaria italica TaxID=4555 RepID=A0A368S1J8_SETIT|nr:jacalin-related lectin 3 [Setaria italica]RCV36278.1 hypothetical protein SETIT_7G305900v2 [Setaria italica]RCV36279.1 hypothetical protein SETIT_7G305900v2 [Setaria italica]